MKSRSSPDPASPVRRSLWLDGQWGRGADFDKPAREFLLYLKVEAGLAPATLEAYSRDLRDLFNHLHQRKIGDLRKLKPDDLAAAITKKWLIYFRDQK